MEGLFHFNSIHPFGLLPPNILAIRVTVLNDATCLGFRVPHFMSDSQTLHDIVAAYTDLLAGTSIQKLVLPPDATVPASTFIEDIAVDLPKGLSLEDIAFLHTKDVVGVGLLDFVHFVSVWLCRRIMWKLFKGTRSVEKFIHLPKALVSKWRAETQKELDGQDSEIELKLTELDVITSWLLQVRTSQPHHTKDLTTPEHIRQDRPQANRLNVRIFIPPHPPSSRTRDYLPQKQPIQAPRYLPQHIHTFPNGRFNPHSSPRLPTKAQS